MSVVQLILKSSAFHARSLMMLLLWTAWLNLPASTETGSPAPAAAPSSDKTPDRTKDDFWWSERFDRVRFTNRAASHYFLTDPQANATTPIYIFLPPVPPPLGVDFPPLGRLVPGAPPAPPELAAFVNELFYPQFGARLAANDLPKGLWQQIQAYRSARTELQNELRSRIAEYKDAENQTRERQLAAFAALQTPRIAALEATAEKFRTDLQQTRLFGFFAMDDPGKEEAGRPVPSAQNGSPTPADFRMESEILRHAAYYEKELSAAQRHLLLEAAIELESHSDSGPLPVGNKFDRPVLHFSPETARITLPPDLAEPLEKLIDEYVSTKNSLKAELRETLLRNDPSSENSFQALKQLAIAQAPRFAAVDVMAEDIRRGLSSLPNPPGPPAPPALPPALMERISTYRMHKLEMLRTLHGMLAGIRESADPATGRVNVKNITRPNPLSVMRDGATAAQSKQMNLQESVADFNLKQTALIAALNKETQGIREALSDYVRTTGRPNDRKSIDDLLKDFENARQKQELWDKYRDYQVAVLMPGLSPEQRRLLFDAAVEQLGLPLPSGRMVH